MTSAPPQAHPSSVCVCSQPLLVSAAAPGGNRYRNGVRALTIDAHRGGLYWTAVLEGSLYTCIKINIEANCNAHSHPTMSYTHLVLTHVPSHPSQHMRTHCA